jgi:hypothetical protein
MRLYRAISLLLLTLSSCLCLPSETTYGPCSTYSFKSSDKWQPEARLWSDKDFSPKQGLGWKVTQKITTNGKDAFNYVYSFVQETNGVLQIYAGPASGTGKAPDQQWRVDVTYSNNESDSYWISSNVQCHHDAYKGIQDWPITKVAFSLRK